MDGEHPTQVMRYREGTSRNLRDLVGSLRGGSGTARCMPRRLVRVLADDLLRLSLAVT